MTHSLVKVMLNIVSLQILCLEIKLKIISLFYSKANLLDYDEQL